MLLSFDQTLGQFFHRKCYIFWQIWQSTDLATFWAFFPQNHLVTLFTARKKLSKKWRQRHFNCAFFQDAAAAAAAALIGLSVFSLSRVFRTIQVGGGMMRRVARWHVFKPKIQIWVNFGGPWNEKKLVYYTVIWNIIRRFGTFLVHLVN
jgi:hypothetical protein